MSSQSSSRPSSPVSKPKILANCDKFIKLLSSKLEKIKRFKEFVETVDKDAVVASASKYGEFSAIEMMPNLFLMTTGDNMNIFTSDDEDLIDGIYKDTHKYLYELGGIKEEDEEYSEDELDESYDSEVSEGKMEWVRSLI